MILRYLHWGLLYRQAVGFTQLPDSILKLGGSIPRSRPESSPTSLNPWMINFLRIAGGSGSPVIVERGPRSRLCWDRALPVTLLGFPRSLNTRPIIQQPPAPGLHLYNNRHPTKKTPINALQTIDGLSLC